MKTSSSIFWSSCCLIIYCWASPSSNFYSTCFFSRSFHQYWPRLLLAYWLNFPGGRRATSFAVKRSWAVRLSFSRLVALLTDEFVEAGLDGTFMGTNGVFSYVDSFGWHEVVKRNYRAKYILLARKILVFTRNGILLMTELNYLC